MDDFVMDVIGQRISTFLGKVGRGTLRRLVEQELGTQGHDPQPEMRRLKARLEGIATKADSVIDLAASSSDCKDLLSARLGRLRVERQEVESRPRELELVPVHKTDPETVVDAILDGLTDARRIFEHGTLEERKRVVRAFVDGMTVVGSERSGQIRMKKLPAPESLSAGSSVESLAGVRWDAGQTNLPWKLELVPLAFEARGTVLVPA